MLSEKTVETVTVDRAALRCGDRRCAARACSSGAEEPMAGSCGGMRGSAEALAAPPPLLATEARLEVAAVEL